MLINSKTRLRYIRRRVIVLAAEDRLLTKQCKHILFGKLNQTRKEEGDHACVPTHPSGRLTD